MWIASTQTLSIHLAVILSHSMIVINMIMNQLDGDAIFLREGNKGSINMIVIK